MEPQIPGSRTSEYYDGQKVYGRKTGCARFGCFGVFGAALIIALIAAAGYFFVFPALSPNSISGSLLDVAIVPSKDGEKLWILTDGSFSFIKTTKSPGRTSTGRSCIFCKTWTYIYDPEEGKVLNKTKTEQEDIVTITNIEYAGGKVWVFVKEYGDNDAKIETYDPETGEKTSGTGDFIKNNPELSSGITGIHYHAKEKELRIKTRDGREFTFDPETETFSGKKDDKKPEDSSLVSVIILASEESSSPRKTLYKVTGQKSKLEKSSLDLYVDNPSTMKFFYNADAEKIGGTYLEGIIYHQDEDCIIIIYLDQLGKKASRIMTCIDAKSGKELWTVKPDQMFDEMKIDENDDSFSSLFFTKDDIGVKRMGNIVVLQLKYKGLIIFDYKTGGKIRELDI